MIGMVSLNVWAYKGSNIPPIPSEPFAPSNAKTTISQFIEEKSFFSAQKCAHCHQDVFNAWSQSLHRNAAREPFYRESADILLKTRGIEFTRHCESCHTPVALLSGALTSHSPKQTAPFTEMDSEGLSCVICHSIVETRLDGTGSYTIKKPALLVKEDGTDVSGDLPDEQIMANLPDHKRAMMRPLLKKPEFCAACHKVTAPPTLNGYKQILGFSAYDEWQQSGASKESVLPFYTRSERQDCRACHMPKVPSTQDYGAKEGVIALHRWPGANTAAPAFYGQQQQVDTITNFLKANVLTVDILGIKQDNQVLIPLHMAKENYVTLAPGTELTAEVVIANRNAAHSFPPEVRDLYEAWVELEALDAQGQTIFHSGFINTNGLLDESAHVYKTIILDGEGKQITRHQIWLTKIKGYDNAIPAGKTDVVHFEFSLPNDINTTKRITLRAKVNYRRFNQEYTNYVLGRQKKDMVVPIVQMASIETQLLSPSKNTPTLELNNKAEARRWNDYGIALLEQTAYGQATSAFQKASEFDPNDSQIWVNRAIGEMRSERFGPEREQLRKAAELLVKALSLDPNNLRAKFYQALVWRGQGKSVEALNQFKVVASGYPRDREVLKQYGQTLYTTGQYSEALVVLEKALAIDPNDASIYKLLSPLYEGAGRHSEAIAANESYLQFKDDPWAENIASQFFVRHPEWREERGNVHVHGQAATKRPVLIGSNAAPMQ